MISFIFLKIKNTFENKDFFCMRILLVGEYSRLHNSLKEGLIELGHHVTIIGKGDGFKKYPVDHSLEATYIPSSTLLTKIRHAIHRISGFDIHSIETLYQFYKKRSFFKNYDVVQLINEYPFETHPILEKLLLQFIFKHNATVFLSACGEDYLSVSYLLQHHSQYHILTPYLNDSNLKNTYQYSLKYTKPSFKRLHHFVFKHIKGVIPTDMDYVPPLKGHPLARPLIPNAINTATIDFIPNNIKEKIVIFHGINTANIPKKGNDFFTEALSRIQKKYSDHIEVIVAQSLPYAQYIKAYKSAHILLDQVYSYDQGYNALEAMAMGKVVFTGAEDCFISHFDLNETVAINATPDVDTIYQQLEWLILHPEEIVQIGKNARAFIEREHHYITIAQRYITTWTS